MQTNKLIGIVLLVAGVALAFWGYQMSGSMGAKLGSAFGGGMPNEVMYRYVGGAALGAIGALLVMKN